MPQNILFPKYCSGGDRVFALHRLALAGAMKNQKEQDLFLFRQEFYRHDGIRINKLLLNN